VETVIIKFVADTDGLQPAIKQLEAIGKITAEDAARIEKLNAEQKEYIQTVNQTTTAFGQLSEEAKDVAATINAQVLQGVADAMAEMGEEAQKGAGKFKSLKAELRELKAQIASGSLGAKEMREATKRAAELQDTIGDVSEKVRGLASDTKYIDSAVTAIRGLAAAGAIAQGSMALLGSENEDLQKTMMKVQAATAVLMGVQEVATIVTGQSALKTLFLDTAQKAAAVSSRVLGVTITTSMAAATMGLSLVIGAIAALVVSMDDANEAGKQSEEELKQAAEERKREQEQEEQNRKRRLESQVTAEQQVELNRLKRREKTLANELEYEKRAYQIRKENLAQAWIDQEINGKEFNLRMRDNEEQFQFDIAKIRKRYSDEATKKRQEELAKIKKERQDLLKDLEAMPTPSFNVDIKFPNAMQLQQEIETRISPYIQAQLDAVKEFNIEHDKLMEEFYASGIDKFEDFLNKKRETEAESNRKRAENMRMAETAASIFQVGLDVFKELNNRKLESELSMLSQQKDATLRNTELTEAQRIKIEERYRQQEKRIKEQAFKQQKQADVIQATINTALAVSRALATPPSPNVAAAVAAGVAGGAQIALIASQPVPRFATGTEMFNTSGTGTSDSGLAWLSNGERVVPASINAEYWGALSAIHNRKVSPRLANQVIEELSHGRGEAGFSFDYDRLGRVVSGKQGSKVVINLDERGFTKHVLRENSRTTYLNKKMRLNA